jgi:hypothetical protein
VTIRYPGLPKNGHHWGYLVLRVAIMVLVGWTFASPKDLTHRLFEASTVTVLFALVGLALLGWAAYLLVRLGLDLAQPTSVTGEVLWTQVWKQRSRENGPDEPTLYYLALDEGREDRTVAWVLPAALADTCRTGDEITMRVRRWTRWATAVDLLRRGPEWDAWESELARGTLRDKTETLVAAAMAPPSPAPAWVRASELLTQEEAGRVLGGVALTAFTGPRSADAPQLAGFDAAGIRGLDIEVSRGDLAAGIFAERRSAGTVLPNIGADAYQGPDWAVASRNGVVIELRLGPAAPATAPRFLPWLLHVAVGRLPAS